MQELQLPLTSRLWTLVGWVHPPRLPMPTSPRPSMSCLIATPTPTPRQTATQELRTSRRPGVSHPRIPRPTPCQTATQELRTSRRPGVSHPTPTPTPTQHQITTRGVLALRRPGVSHPTPTPTPTSRTITTTQARTSSRRRALYLITLRKGRILQGENFQYSTYYFS